LVKVFHAQLSDLRAPEVHLQAHRNYRAVAQAFDRVLRRSIEQLGRVHLEKGQRRAFTPIDRGAFHLGYGIALGVAVVHQMLEQAGESGEADER